MALNYDVSHEKHHPIIKIITHPLFIGCLFFFITLSRDAFLLWGFGMNHSYDSYGYIHLGKEYVDPSLTPNFYIRTLPYLIMNGITGSSYNPYPLMWLQFVLGAFSVGYFTFASANKNVKYSYLVGLFLSFDLGWGALNRVIHPEGPLASLYLITIAILLRHYDRKTALKPCELILAGMFFGWTFTFRSNGTPIILLMPILYFLMTHSWKKSLWIISGSIIFLLLCMGINQYKVGHFSLTAPSGRFLMVPVFYNHLFSPNDGPASNELASYWQETFPGKGYDFVTVDSAQGNLTALFDTITQKHGFSNAQVSNFYTRVYVEQIIHHPFVFAKKLLSELGYFLALPPSGNAYYALTPWYSQFTAPQICAWDWCLHAFDQRISAESPFIKAYEVFAAISMQPYTVLQHLFFEFPMWRSPNSPVTYSTGARNSALIGLFLISVFILFFYRDKEQFIAISSLSILFLTALSVVAGNAVILRYNVPIIPLEYTLSALFYCKIFEFAKS